MTVKSPKKIAEEFRPITMWGYFGYQILFAIPVVGWIFLIVFAITAENVNLRNFARSYFCILIIYAVFFLLLMVTGGLAAFIEAVTH